MVKVGETYLNPGILVNYLWWAVLFDHTKQQLIQTYNQNNTGHPVIWHLNRMLWYLRIYRIFQWEMFPNMVWTYTTETYMVWTLPRSLPTVFFCADQFKNKITILKNETAAQKVIIPAKTYSSRTSGTISYNPWGPFFCGYVFVFFLVFFLMKTTKTYPLTNSLAGKFLFFWPQKPPKKKKNIPAKKLVPRDYNL